MKNLNKIYWLRQEIKQITEQINALTVMCGSASYSAIPGGNNNNSSPIERYVLRKEKLLEKLQSKLDELIAETQRIEDVIEGIDEVEIRLIARKRFIENKDWQIIGDEMFMDRTTVSRKIKKYFGE